MAINGIDPRPALATVQPRTSQEGRVAPRDTQAAPKPASAAVPAAATVLGESLAAEPPAGTDPALWAVLTSEERAYFAQVQSLGPLTYGRGERAPALPRGGRIDVQV